MPIYLFDACNQCRYYCVTFKTTLFAPSTIFATINVHYQIIKRMHLTISVLGIMYEKDCTHGMFYNIFLTELKASSRYF